MARYIDADLLAAKWKPIAEYDCLTGHVVDACLIELNDAPTVDAAPVVHGKWFDGESDDGGEVWYCNRCSYPVKTILGSPIYKYCPNCGAKMDGGKDAEK